MAGAVEFDPSAPSEVVSAPEFDPNAPSEIAEEPKPEPRSFLQRAKDTIVGGAKAIGHVAGEQADLATRFLTNPESVIGSPEARAQAADQFLLTNPSKRRELERGVGDVTTLGYANKAAEALDRVTGENKMSPEQQAKDAESAPGYRTAGQVAGSVLPNPLGEAVGVAGKAIGAGAERIAPDAVAAARRLVENAPSALTGAAKNVASYEAQAPAAAALSADSAGHRGEAAKAAAFDPAGLLISATTGAAPAIINGAGKVIKSYIDKAPAAEAEQLMSGVMAGEGKSGRATKKAAKILEPKQEVAVEELRADKDLRDASAKPAKEALPIFHEKLDEIGSQLDPHYDTVDKATGGVSLNALNKFLDGVAEELDKEPLNEQYVKAVEGIKKSANNSWGSGETSAPATMQHGVGTPPREWTEADWKEAEREWSGKKGHSTVGDVTNPGAKGAAEDSPSQLHARLEDLKAARKNAVGVSAKALDEQIADIEGKAKTIVSDLPVDESASPGDVKVPTRAVRKMVTRLQKRGTEVINALNPGEASQMKADMASMMKEFIDQHLAEAAQKSPEAAHAVDAINTLNPRYSAVAAMTNAIEQRQWGEATGAVSTAGHMGKFLKESGAAAAIPLALHGNIPAAVGAVFAPHITPAIKQIGKGVVSGTAQFSRSPAYQAAISGLAKAARATQSMADFVAQATRAGLPVAKAREIWQAAHPQKPPQQAQEGDITL